MILWSGVTTAWGTVLKGCSSRKVETCCLRVSCSCGQLSTLTVYLSLICTINCFQINLSLIFWQKSVWPLIFSPLGKRSSIRRHLAQIPTTYNSSIPLEVYVGDTWGCSYTKGPNEAQKKEKQVKVGKGHDRSQIKFCIANCLEVHEMAWRHTGDTGAGRGNPGLLREQKEFLQFPYIALVLDPTQPQISHPLLCSHSAHCRSGTVLVLEM